MTSSRLANENIKFGSHWFDLVGIRTSDLPQGKSALLPIQPPRVIGGDVSDGGGCGIGVGIDIGVFSGSMILTNKPDNPDIKWRYLSQRETQMRVV